MPKRSSKTPNPDSSQIALDIVERVTGEKLLSRDADLKKNPAAVALGRLGGRKGGPARAKALTQKKRSAIAKKAAQARWKTK